MILPSAVASLLILLTVAPLAAQGLPQADPLKSGRYNPDRRSDFLHMRLTLRFTPDSFREQTCEGRVEYEIRPTSGQLSEVRLDAEKMKITAVEILGDAIRPRFSYDDHQLAISLPKTITEQESVRIAIDYKLLQPERGMYFLTPGGPSGPRSATVYTMGEGLEARSWLPSHDWPNERWTTELFVTVPTGYTAVSNGLLVERTVSSDNRSLTFHWKNDQPVDAHQAGVVVGEYARLEETWRGKPVVAYVPPGKEAAARHTFQRVPEMLEFYTQFTGIDFPYPSYTHVAVPDHFHRGMEQAAFSMIDPAFFATPLVDGFQPLVPGWPGYTIETNLIAHMLAHQWFGGIANYRGLPHAWLNEGFATYMHLLWTGKGHSEDTFRYLMRQSVPSIAAADTPETGKAMVLTSLSTPMEVFRSDGGKVYFKGAWVLHMLRNQLGPDTFRKGIQAYLQGHRFGHVETGDLRRALEEASGRDLERFFDLWIYGRAIPKMKLTYKWEAAQKQVHLLVEQTQRITDAAPAFFFPIDLSFRVEGKDQLVNAYITQARQELVYDFPSEPEMVAPDPNVVLLADFELEAPAAILSRQAVEGPSMFSRWLAIQALAKTGGNSPIQPLEKIIADEGQFWGVRTAAADALARIQTPEALAALLRQAKLPLAEPLALGGLLRALSSFTYSVEAQATLNRFAATTASGDKVRAMALLSLARMRGSSIESARTMKVLADSAQPQLPPLTQLAALSALGLREEASGFAEVLSASTPARPTQVRITAMNAVARIARERDSLREQARTALRGYLVDSNMTIRMGAAGALGEFGDLRTLPELSLYAASGRTQLDREAGEAGLSRLRQARDPRVSGLAVLDRLTELEKQNAELRQKMDDLLKEVKKK